MSNITLLVVSNPSAPYLKWLSELPSDVNYVVGNTVETLSGIGERADAILYCMGPGLSLKAVWDLAPRVQWIHSLSAGLESILFPALAESTVPMTNGRGVFKDSLGEFVVASILHFAKDLRRMVRSQEAGRWDQFDVEMVAGKTLGVIGYGEIGRAAAVRAHALGMKIHVIRRRPQLSDEDPIVEKSFSVADRGEMMAEVDYLLVAAPLTGETKGLVGTKELRAMKASAVVMNVGRGPVIDEAALIAALRDGVIKGAALDVFDKEPLPEGHPFWSLSNVLLSPHCADHTATWTDEAMQFFLENLQRYRDGQPLLNLVDKKSGY
jgi:phosphoglycerate dehydrogenase-like enzyme